MEGAKGEVIKAGEFEKSRLHFHVILLPLSTQFVFAC
jgi:hypothetical protein